MVGVVLPTSLTIDPLDDGVRTGLHRLAEFHGCTSAEMAGEILRRAIVVLADDPAVTEEIGLGRRLAATLGGCGLGDPIRESRDCATTGHPRCTCDRP